MRLLHLFVSIALLTSSQYLLAAKLRIDVTHLHQSAPLLLHSLRYKTQGAETYSITRLSYLLSGFELQQSNGKWVDLSGQQAWIDHAKHRTSFTLDSVPQGSYRALRFRLGVPKNLNHSDPTKFGPKHPLNPNLNQLHWNWQGGFIFLALEGKYRTAGENSGFVYHLANDPNYSPVTLNSQFHVKSHTAITLGFDIHRLLQIPRPVSFIEDGDSTHSRPGDQIASALVANLPNSFDVHAVRYPSGEAPQASVKPLYLPEKINPYRFKTSRFFTRPDLPRDNPLLVERVALGKALFNDKQLSRDHTISCASCHQSDHAFSDPRVHSAGVEQQLGRRHSMPLFNLAWKSQFFWDGRASSLREQALLPIQDPTEMDLDLTTLIKRLSADLSYAPKFKNAFGSSEVTSEKIALALENFMLSLTSYQSKFDKAMAGKAKLSDKEQRGMELFFTEYEPRSGKFGADCFHCHGGANFSDHQFHNNGLTPSNNDLGRYELTGIESDKLKFSTPSLRQLVHTAPYMHDGRFSTLEEVVAHYSGPMHQSKSLDPNLSKHPKLGLQLSADDQAALVAFIMTLSE